MKKSTSVNAQLAVATFLRLTEVKYKLEQLRILFA